MHWYALTSLQRTGARGPARPRHEWTDAAVPGSREWPVVPGDASLGAETRHGRTLRLPTAFRHPSSSPRGLHSPAPFLNFRLEPQLPHHDQECLECVLDCWPGRLLLLLSGYSSLWRAFHYSSCVTRATHMPVSCCVDAGLANTTILSVCTPAAAGYRLAMPGSTLGCIRMTACGRFMAWRSASKQHSQPDHSTSGWLPWLLPFPACAFAGLTFRLELH
jgi:hypothetical protein